MCKVELLAPAGDMDTLIAAIDNGADAVYIGGKFFGARAFAKNFTNEEIIKAISFCHLYKVKLYVTANTVIFEDEIKDFLNYMKFLYENGVDAVIMQDLGMISLVRRLIPDLEIHASTQMNCYNDECLYFLKSLGVKRAVLARETSIDEIKKLKCPIEKEIFIHGALCVSYSGQCLFSALNGGRSGNRGSCVGCCRWKFELYDDDKINTDGNYLLSTKELCTVNYIKEIIQSGVDSLKIEGRMKSPEYVGYVTKVYRRLIDAVYAGEEALVTEEEMINLYKLYNREFTSGYLFNDDIYNIKSPNHLGYPIGKVVRFNKRKIYIKLDYELNQEDGIRFNSLNKGMIVNLLYNEQGLLVNHISKGEVAILDNKIGLNRKCVVSKTLDRHLMMEKALNKKIKVDFKVSAIAHDYLTLTASDGMYEVSKKSILLDEAIDRPTSFNEVLDKLNKLGGTPFVLNECDIVIDKAFIPMSALNELRREVISLLAYKRSKCERKVHFDYKKKLYNGSYDGFSVLVRNMVQLKYFLGKVRIYTEDYDLYKKYKDYDVYYKLPRIMHEYPNFKGEKLLVSELGSVYKYSKDNIVIADYPLNITNSETINFLYSLGVKGATISPEVKNTDVILKYSKHAERIIYGKADLMILKDFRKDGKFLKHLDDYFQIIHGDYTTILNHENIFEKGVGRIILSEHEDIDKLMKKFKI